MSDEQFLNRLEELHIQCVYQAEYARIVILNKINKLELAIYEPIIKSKKGHRTKLGKFLYSLSNLLMALRIQKIRKVEIKNEFRIPKEKKYRTDGMNEIVTD